MVTLTKPQLAEGVDIAITEGAASTRNELGHHVIPDAVSINGVPVLMPQGSTITISPINEYSAVTVTLTLLVRRLTIGDAA